MEQNKLKQMGLLLGFVIMAGISCWATEHSFHLLLQQWKPEALVWGLTIAFFVVSSYGTKLIVDALNRDIYIEHRRRTFWVGVTLTVIFWLLMSMPTNTHTFFYNHYIGNKVQEDLTTTDTYLQQIAERKNVDSAYYEVHEQVNELFKLVESEMNGTGGTGNKGNGEYVRQLLGEINPILEAEIPGTSIKFHDEPWAWLSRDQRILSDYQQQKDKALEDIKNENYRVSKNAASEASKISGQIAMMKDTISHMVQLGSLHEDVITQSDGVILSGYTCVKNNKDFVIFNSPSDSEVYTAENLETRTKRMISVIDVWIDFIGGKYPLSFLLYVLLSILVDVAAFIFFNLAFRKTYEDN